MKQLLWDSIYILYSIVWENPSNTPYSCTYMFDRWYQNNWSNNSCTPMCALHVFLINDLFIFAFSKHRVWNSNYESCLDIPSHLLSKLTAFRWKIVEYLWWTGRFHTTVVFVWLQFLYACISHDIAMMREMFEQWTCSSQSKITSNKKRLIHRSEGNICNRMCS